MNYDDDETAADIRREARRDAKRDPISLDQVLDLALEVVELHPDDPIVDEEITIYSSGLVCCSVCAPAGMDREVVERRVNVAAPTGISSRWRVSDEDFNTGHPNPTPCEQDSTRLHYLLNC